MDHRVCDFADPVWRDSSVGESTRFIPVVSLVRLQFPLLFFFKPENWYNVRVFGCFYFSQMFFFSNKCRSVRILLFIDNRCIRLYNVFQGDDIMKYYKIDEFAKIIGVSSETLRRWDRTGKFKCHHKTPSGYRIYSEEQIDSYIGNETSKKKVTAIDFELFKSDVCQKVKNNPVEWLKTTLLNDDIRKYYNEGNTLFALYLLAMVDKQLKRLDLKPAKQYRDLRRLKMATPVYPMSSYFAELDWSGADPDFLKYNIVEGEIDNVF